VLGMASCNCWWCKICTAESEINPCSCFKQVKYPETSAKWMVEGVKRYRPHTVE